MASVFNDYAFAVQYEQRHVNGGSLYHTFAKDSLQLLIPQTGLRVMDLGCGTGISTTTLFDVLNPSQVVGADKSQAFLDIARLKFGFEPVYADQVLDALVEFNPSDDFLKGKIAAGNLLTHLKKSRAVYSLVNDRVAFHVADASAVSAVSDALFDVVFANQVFHWFRRFNVSPGDINKEYEQAVLQAVRSSLHSQGTFVFNTTGADFTFADDQKNKMHMIHHPFYKVFMQQVYGALGTPVPKQHQVLNHHEIMKVMDENGFCVKTVQEKVYRKSAESLLETCVIGAHMQIFQKSGIDVHIDDRKKMLSEAIRRAMDSDTLNATPVFETGVHYIVEKA
ncbi:class I SAM-dependent methyltransferase [Candidatus Woesearchaeota archaeon]|nr:MAG: class I SAM-dependent methyltransferase [Candidatus Woesearchaeota archaeon]